MKPKLPEVVQYQSNDQLAPTDDLDLPKLQLPNVQLEPSASTDTKIKDLLNDINARPILDTPYEVNMPTLTYDVPNFILPPQDTRSYKEISQMMNAGNELDLGTLDIGQSPAVDLLNDKPTQQHLHFEPSKDPNTFTTTSDGGRVVNIVKYIPVSDNNPQKQEQEPQKDVQEISISESLSVPELRAKSRNQQDNEPQQRQLRPVIKGNKVQQEPTPDISFQDVVIDPRHWAEGPNPKSAVKLPTRHHQQKIQETTVVQLRHPKKSTNNPIHHNATRIPSGKAELQDRSEIEIDICDNVQRQSIEQVSEKPQQVLQINQARLANDSPAYYEQNATIASPRLHKDGIPVLQPKREQYYQEPFSAFESPVPGENDGTYILKQPVNKVMSYSPIRMPGQKQASINQNNAIRLGPGDQQIDQEQLGINYPEHRGVVQLDPIDAINTQQPNRQYVQHPHIGQDGANVIRQQHAANPYQQNNITIQNKGDINVDQSLDDNYAKKIAMGQNIDLDQYSEYQLKQQHLRQQQKSQYQAQFAKQRSSQPQNADVESTSLEYQEFKMENSQYINQNVERDDIIYQDSQNHVQQTNIPQMRNQYSQDELYQQNAKHVPQNRQYYDHQQQNYTKHQSVKNKDNTIQYHKFETQDYQQGTSPQRQQAYRTTSEVQRYEYVTASGQREQIQQYNTANPSRQQERPQSGQYQKDNFMGSPVRQFQGKRGGQIPIKPTAGYILPTIELGDDVNSVDNLAEYAGVSDANVQHRQQVKRGQPGAGRYDPDAYQDDQENDPYDNVGYLSKQKQEQRDGYSDGLEEEQYPQIQQQNVPRDIQYQIQTLSGQPLVNRMADDVVNTIQRKKLSSQNVYENEVTKEYILQRQDEYPTQDDFYDQKQSPYNSASTTIKREKVKMDQNMAIQDTQKQQTPKKDQIDYEQANVVSDQTAINQYNPLHPQSKKSILPKEKAIPTVDAQAEQLQQYGQNIDQSVVRRNYIAQVESGYIQALNKISKPNKPGSPEYQQQDVDQQLYEMDQDVQIDMVQGKRPQKQHSIPVQDGKYEGQKAQPQYQEANTYRAGQKGDAQLAHQEAVNVQKGQMHEYPEQDAQYDANERQEQQFDDKHIPRQHKKGTGQMKNKDIYSTDITIEGKRQQQDYDQKFAKLPQIQRSEEKPNVQNAQCQHNNMDDLSEYENQNVQHLSRDTHLDESQYDNTQGLQHQYPDRHQDIRQAQRWQRQIHSPNGVQEPKVNKIDQLPKNQQETDYNTKLAGTQPKQQTGDSPVVQLDGKYVSQPSTQGGYSAIPSQTAHALTNQSDDSAMRSYQATLDISYPENSDHSVEHNQVQYRKQYPEQTKDNVHQFSNKGNEAGGYQQNIYPTDARHEMPGSTSDRFQDVADVQRLHGKQYSPNQQYGGKSPQSGESEVLESYQGRPETGQHQQDQQNVSNGTPRREGHQDNSLMDDDYNGPVYTSDRQDIADDSNLFVSFVDPKQKKNLNIDELKVQHERPQYQGQEDVFVNTNPQKQLQNRPMHQEQFYDPETGKMFSVSKQPQGQLHGHPDAQEHITQTQKRNEFPPADINDVQQTKVDKSKLNNQKYGEQSVIRDQYQSNDDDKYENFYMHQKPKNPASKERINELYPENYKEYQYDEYDGVPNHAQKQQQRKGQPQNNQLLDVQQIGQQPDQYNEPINYINRLQQQRIQARGGHSGQQNSEQQLDTRYSQVQRQNYDLQYQNVQLVNQQGQDIVDDQSIQYANQDSNQRIPKVNVQQSQQIKQLPKGMWSKSLKQRADDVYEQQNATYQRQNPSIDNYYNNLQAQDVPGQDKQQPGQFNLTGTRIQQHQQQINNLTPNFQRARSQDSIYEHQRQFTRQQYDERDVIQNVRRVRGKQSADAEYNQANLQSHRAESQQYNQQYGIRQQPDQLVRSQSQPGLSAYKQQIILNTKSKGLYNILNKVKREKLQQTSHTSANYDVLGDIRKQQPTQRHHQVDSFQFIDIISKKPRPVEKSKVTESLIKKFERENSMTDEVEIEQLYPQKIISEKQPVRFVPSQSIDIPQEQVGFLEDSIYAGQPVNKQQISQIYDNYHEKDAKTSKMEQKSIQTPLPNLQASKKSVQFLKQSERDITEDDIDLGKRVKQEKQLSPRDLFSTNLPIMEFVAQQEIFTNHFISQITTDQPHPILTHKSFVFTKSQVNDSNYDLQTRAQATKFTDDQLNQHSKIQLNKKSHQVQIDNAQVQWSSMPQTDYLQAQITQQPTQQLPDHAILNHPAQHQDIYQQYAQKLQKQLQQQRENEIQAINILEKHRRQPDSDLLIQQTQIHPSKPDESYYEGNVQRKNDNSISDSLPIQDAHVTHQTIQKSQNNIQIDSVNVTKQNQRDSDFVTESNVVIEQKHQSPKQRSQDGYQQHTKSDVDTQILESYVENGKQDDFVMQTSAKLQRKGDDYEDIKIQDGDITTVKQLQQNDPDTISSFMYKTDRENPVLSLNAQQNQQQAQYDIHPVLISKSQVTQLQGPSTLSPKRQVQISEERDAITSEFTRIQPSIDTDSWNEQLAERIYERRDNKEFPENVPQKHQKIPRDDDNTIIAGAHRDTIPCDDPNIAENQAQRRVQYNEDSPIQEAYPGLSSPIRQQDVIPSQGVKRDVKEADQSIAFGELLPDKQSQQPIADPEIQIQNPQFYSQKEYQQNIQMANPKLPRAAATPDSIKIISPKKSFQSMKSSELNEISLLDHKVGPKPENAPDNVTFAQNVGNKQEPQQHDYVIDVKQLKDKQEIVVNAQTLNVQKDSKQTENPEDTIIQIPTKNLSQEETKEIPQDYPGKQANQPFSIQDPKLHYPKVHNKQYADNQQILDVKHQEKHNLEVSDVIQNAERNDVDFVPQDEYAKLDVKRKRSQQAQIQEIQQQHQLQYQKQLVEDDGHYPDSVAKIGKKQGEQASPILELHGQIGENQKDDYKVTVQTTTNVMKPVDKPDTIDSLSVQMQINSDKSTYLEQNANISKDSTKQTPIYNPQSNIHKKPQEQYQIDNAQKIGSIQNEDEDSILDVKAKKAQQQLDYTGNDLSVDRISIQTDEGISYDVLNTKNVKKNVQLPTYTQDNATVEDKQRQPEYNTHEDIAKKREEQKQPNTNANYDEINAGRMITKQDDPDIQTGILQREMIKRKENDDIGIDNAQVGQINKKPDFDQQNVHITDATHQKIEKQPYNVRSLNEISKKKINQDEADFQYGELVALKAIKDSEFYGSGVGEIQYLNLLQKSLKLIEESGLRVNEVVRSQIDKSLSTFSARDFHVLCAKLDLRAPLTDVELFVLQDLVKAEEMKGIEKQPENQILDTQKGDKINIQQKSHIDDVLSALVKARRVDRAKLSGLSDFHYTLTAYNIGTPKTKRSSSASVAQFLHGKKSSLNLDEDVSEPEQVNVIQIFGAEKGKQKHSVLKPFQNQGDSIEVLDVTGVYKKTITYQELEQYPSRHVQQEHQQDTTVSNAQRVSQAQKRSKQQIDDIQGTDARRVEVIQKVAKVEEEEYDDYSHNMAQKANKSLKKQEKVNDSQILGVVVERGTCKIEDKDEVRVNDVANVKKDKQQQDTDSDDVLDQFGELNTIVFEPTHQTKAYKDFQDLHNVQKAQKTSQKKEQPEDSFEQILDTSNVIERHIPKKKQEEDPNVSFSIKNVKTHKRTIPRSKSTSSIDDSPLILGIDISGFQNIIKRSSATTNVQNTPTPQQQQSSGSSNPSTSGSNSSSSSGSPPTIIQAKKNGESLYLPSFSASNSFQAFDVVRDVKQCFKELKAFYAKQKSVEKDCKANEDSFNDVAAKCVKTALFNDITQASATIKRVKGAKHDDALMAYQTRVDKQEEKIAESAVTKIKRQYQDEYQTLNGKILKQSTEESDDPMFHSVKVEKINIVDNQFTQLSNVKLQSVVEYVNEEEVGQEVAIAAFQRSQIQIPETTQFTKYNTQHVKIGLPDLRRLKRNDKLELLQQYELQLFPVIVSKLQAIQDSNVSMAQMKNQKISKLGISQADYNFAASVASQHKTLRISGASQSEQYDTLGVKIQDKSDVNKTELDLQDLKVQNKKIQKEKDEDIDIQRTQRTVHFNDIDDAFNEPKLYITKALKQLVSTYGASIDHPIIKHDIEFIQYQYKLLGVNMEEQPQITDEQCEILFTQCQKLQVKQKQNESIQSQDSPTIQPIVRQIQLKSQPAVEQSISSKVDKETTSDFNEIADVRFELKKPKVVEQVKTRQLHTENVDSSLFDNESDLNNSTKQQQPQKIGIVRATPIEMDDSPKKEEVKKTTKQHTFKAIDLISTTSLTQSELSTLSIGDETVVRAERTMVQSPSKKEEDSQFIAKNAKQVVKGTISSVISAKGSSEGVSTLEVAIHGNKESDMPVTCSNIQSVKYQPFETPQQIVKTGEQRPAIKEKQQILESPVKDNITQSTISSEPEQKPQIITEQLHEKVSESKPETVEQQQQTSDINKEDAQMQTQTEMLISVEQSKNREPSLLDQESEHELSPMKMVSYDGSDSFQVAEQKVKVKDQEVPQNHENNIVKKGIRYIDETDILAGGKIKKCSGIQESLIAPHKIVKPGSELTLSNAFSAIQPRTKVEKREQLPEVSFDFAEHVAEPQRVLKTEDLVQMVANPNKIVTESVQSSIVQEKTVSNEPEEDSYYSYSYSSYTETSEESEINDLKQKFNDLTEMLQNYPFFETVYDVCGKCKMNQKNQVEEERQHPKPKNEEKKVNLAESVEYEEPVIIQELRVANKEDVPNVNAEDDTTKQQVIVPVKTATRQVSEQPKFTFKSSKQQIKVQNLQIPIQKAAKVTSQIVNLPPKPRAVKNDAEEITTFNVKKNPSLKYKEFIINEIQPQRVEQREEETETSTSEQISDSSYNNDQVEQILTVILKQPQPEADTLSESTSGANQSDILLQSIQESLGISGTQKSQYSLSNTQNGVVSVPISEISEIPKQKSQQTKSLSLSPIPQHKDGKSEVSSVVEKESGELTQTYELSSSIEPGQVYPKVHKHVHNDNYIDLAPFSAGEVSGYSEFGVAPANIYEKSSTSLEQGEIDYINALKVLGLE